MRERYPALTPELFDADMEHLIASERLRGKILLVFNPAKESHCYRVLKPNGEVRDFPLDEFKTAVLDYYNDKTKGDES